MAAETSPGADGDLVAVGAIGAAVGIRGEVTIVSWTDDPDLRFAVGSVLTTDPAERGPLTVTSSRWQGAKLVVRFEGIEDRNSAEAARRTTLFVPAAARPVLDDPDDFYDTDLVGLEVVDPSGAALGVVSGVEHGAGGDRLVVTHEGREHLVPFVTEIVPRVDLAARRVVVDAPEGLFEL